MKTINFFGLVATKESSIILLRTLDFYIPSEHEETLNA